MQWLQHLDDRLFRFINHSLSNRVFDVLMPILSGNRLFFPAVFVAGFLLLWKGGTRGRLCVLALVLILPLGDGLVCNTIKHAIARPRPFETLANTRQFGKDAAVLPSGSAGNLANDQPRNHKPDLNSMPSSHAANWFAATMIFLVYYRRSWRFFFTMACLVSFSRIYNGVHYPTDVLAGGILGAGYAVAGMWMINAVWNFGGPRWFPIWWRRLPSMLNLENKTAPISTKEVSASSQIDHGIDAHWIRLGYLLIAVLLIGRLFYIHSTLIELSEDEAYQWLWSKHLALSYYSKPPLIAYLQFLGTHIWGDTAFGVRFFSPVIGSMIGVLVLRFFAREINARAGFLMLLILQATPLLALGTTLMTIDPPSVLFWVWAMFAGWKAVQPDGTLPKWCCAGLFMGLGFLSKYTELFQLLCWLVFFALWKPARIHLRRPGPYLALLINILCSIPVLIWNAQHGWITVAHLEERAGGGHQWAPTLRFFWEFLGSEFILLNPFFFVPMIWAAIAFWRNDRKDARLVYLFSMSVPLILCYVLLSFRSRVLPNWIAPAVLPIYFLAAIYWLKRPQFVGALKIVTTVGIIFGLAMVALMHDTNLIKRVTGRALPPKPDPLTRVRAYSEMAKITGEARDRLAASSGKPVFIIGDHYGLVGEISFYLPEAKKNVLKNPTVFYITTSKPENQFYFWPGYEDRLKGENAIFVREIGGPPLVSGWIHKWLSGDTNLLSYQAEGKPPPSVLTNEFESVKDLGLRQALYRGQVFHTIQLFECLNLK